MASRMQDKLQETLDQVGSSTRTQLENMRQAWERVSSIENDPMATSSGFQAMQAAADAKSNPELEHRAQKVTERICENILVVANEPSLAFYRIQEHVRKTLPQLIEKKHEVQHLHKKVQGSCFDTEYAVNALSSMTASTSHFQNIQDLLKNAMFMKQQIQYEQARRQQGRMKPSMYHRSSGAAMMRTQTLDASMNISDRQRRAAEFTQSVQLPTTTSLSCIEDTPARARSSSFSKAQEPQTTQPSASQDTSEQITTATLSNVSEISLTLQTEINSNPAKTVDSND